MPAEPGLNSTAHHPAELRSAMDIRRAGMANAQKTHDKIKRAKARAERELAKARAKTEGKLGRVQAALVAREAEILAKLDRKITRAKAKLKPSPGVRKKNSASPARDRKPAAGGGRRRKKR